MLALDILLLFLALRKKYYFYVCECMSILVYGLHRCAGNCRGQKVVLDPHELEITVGCKWPDVDAGN